MVEANPFFDATTNSMTAWMMTALRMMDNDGKDDDRAIMTLRMTARTMTALMMMAQIMIDDDGKDDDEERGEGGRGGEKRWWKQTPFLMKQPTQ